MVPAGGEEAPKSGAGDWAADAAAREGAGAGGSSVDMSRAGWGEAAGVLSVRRFREVELASERGDWERAGGEPGWATGAPARGAGETGEEEPGGGETPRSTEGEC